MSVATAARAARAKAIPILAWTSLAIATIAGTFAVATFVGDIVRGVLGVFPWGWIPAGLLIAGLVTIVVDLIKDGEPNHPSLIALMLAPSVASAANGRFGDTVTGWANDLNGAVDDGLSEWFGTQSSLGITIICIVVALILANRVIKKGRSGDGGGYPGMR